MKRMKMNKCIACVVAAILFFSMAGGVEAITVSEGCLISHPNYSIPVQSKQPVAYNWNWDLTALDSLCSLPFSDFTFHQYCKAEVTEGFLYLARGNGSPSQLVCFNQQTGEFVWQYSVNDRWNKEHPFVCLPTGILLNFQNTAYFLNEKTGEVYQQWNWNTSFEDKYNPLTSEKPTVPGSVIYVNDTILLVQEAGVNSSTYRCLDVSSMEELWSYSSRENTSSRLMGVQNEYLWLLELTFESSSSPNADLLDLSENAITRLLSISLETGEVVVLNQWEEICRIDFCFSWEGIVLGTLNRKGEASLYTVEKSKGNECKVVTLTKSISWVTLDDTIPITPTLQVEDSFLGFRVFNKEDAYYMAVSVATKDEPGKETGTENYRSIQETLFVMKVNKDGESVWRQTFSSLEKGNGVVEDAFIDGDHLVFQFPYRSSNSSEHVYAFWLELETGDLRQCFYHHFFFLEADIILTNPVFLPGVMFQTSCIHEHYLTSIQGFANTAELYYEKAAVEIDYSEVELEKLYSETLPESYYVKEYTPFAFQEQICYFQATYSRYDISYTIELIRYDVVQQEKLPVQSFVYEDCDNEIDRLILLDNSLVLGVIDSYDEQTIFCFDIVEQELLWKKKALFVSQIEDCFLFRNSDITDDDEEPLSNVEYMLFNPIENETIGMFSFPSLNVQYIGEMGKETVLFQRNSRYVSLVNMQSGTLLNEFIFSDRVSYEFQCVGQYLLYATREGTLGCIDIVQQQVLWEQYLENEIDYFFDRYSVYGEWNVDLVKEDLAFAYSDNECILFDLSTGVFVQEFKEVKGEIAERCSSQSDYPLFKLYSNEAITKCMQLHIDSADQSELLVFPEVHYEDGKDYYPQVCSVTIQGTQYFAYYDFIYANFFCICRYPLVEESRGDVSFLELGTDFSNYLYYSPYLLFQTSIGDNNSQFYLVAFHTETGEITKIHKGLHERVYIEDEKLVFSQCGECYTCSVGEFQSIEKIKVLPTPPALSSGGTMQPVCNYQKGVPEAYHALDLYYVNKIAFGSFTSTEQEDMIFITGDDYAVTIGVMEEQDGLVIPTMTGRFKTEKKDRWSTGKCGFYQSLFLDYDSDGLEELFVLTEEYVVVCDYNTETHSLDMHGILYVDDIKGRILERELLFWEGVLYIQYTPLSNSNERTLYQFCVEYNPTMKKPYHVKACSLPLPTEMFQCKAVHNLSSFQFLEKPVYEESPYVTFVPTECEQYPKTKMPPLYEIKEDQLNEKEEAYCKKRNELLEKFLGFLEEGNDPFVGMHVRTRYRYPTLEFDLSLTPASESEGRITQLNSFDVLFSNDQSYVLVRITDEVGYRHMVLFSPEWELLDYRFNEMFDRNDNALVIVSEEQTDCFWFQVFSEEDNPSSLIFGKVLNGKLVVFEKPVWVGIVMRNGKPYFSYTNAIQRGGFSLPEGYMVTCGLNYMDPFSGVSVNGWFLDRIMGNVEALYCQYFLEQARYLSFGNCGVLNEHCYMQLPDDRQKIRYLSNISRTIIHLEFFLRKRGELNSVCTVVE